MTKPPEHPQPDEELDLSYLNGKTNWQKDVIKSKGGLRMKCFYHIDNDGKCAGAIVKMVHPGAEMFPIDYNISFPMDDIEKDEWVFIVDFSISPEEMKRLREITPNVCWIDHHLSAIEKYGDYGDEIDGIRKDGTAGCQLAWEWFFPHTELPWAVKMIANWDVWQHNDNPDCLEFNAGLSIYDDIPENGDFWESLIGEDWAQTSTVEDAIMEKGRIILEHMDMVNIKFCQNYGYEVEFEDHLCFVINRPKPSSKAFMSVSDRYEVYIGYVHNGDEFIFSIYSDTPGIDVKKIAEKYGGGGHVQAAGWHSTEIPFSPKKKGPVESMLDAIQTL